MRTAYFDTTDFRLWERGLTLQHRAGAPEGGGTWTLQLPSDRSDRADPQKEEPGRTARSWLGPEDTIPPEAASILRGVVRRGTLEQQVDLHTTRRPAAVDDGSSLGDLVRSAVRTGLDRLLDHDWRLRASPSLRPHDVHQARVATRRLRSDLKTFGVVLDPVWVTHVRGDLKWVGSTLGAVRDRDVLAGHLDDGPPDLRQALDDQRDAARADVSVMLDSTRYIDLLDRLHAAADRPPFLDAGGLTAGDRAADVLPALVGARWRAVRRQVRRAGPTPSDAQLHQIRIKAKQLRYAAEAAVPVVGKAARRTAADAAAIQTILGRHHDAVAAEAWLRQTAAPTHADNGEDARTISPPGPPSLAPPSVFEAGRLCAREQRDQRRLGRKWRKPWDSLSRAKHRRWLA